MGKVKPAPQGAGKKDSQTSPSLRRSSRGTIAIEDNTIAGTPDADPLPGPSNLERRRIAATLPGSTTASGIKRPPPTGRKLSALSAHKRRLPTDATPGSIASAGRRQFSSPPQKEATKTPSQEPQMEGAKSPPIKGAPPMTVAEAQELGELARLNDDSTWALEGLSSGNGVAKQTSLATLAEIYASRRNRLALHSSSLGNDFLTGIGQLKIGDDPVLALGAAAILLLTTQIGGDPMVFAKEEISKLVVQILQVSSSLAPGAVPAPASRILRILHEASSLKIVPREASFNAPSVALGALSSSLDPQNCPAEIDKTKHTLRETGVLKAVAQLAADQSQALVDTSPTMETVQSLWRLERALVVLEHSCFALTENEIHLIEMEVSQGVPPMVVRMSLAQWMVQQIQTLSRQTVVSGLKKDCLRGLLAVLMNITHNNTSGCEKIVAFSALEIISYILSKICLGSPPYMRGVLQSADELKAWLDELNGCLGVLINCAEENRENRVRMRTMPLLGSSQETDSGAATAGGGAELSSGLVGILGRLISTVMSDSNDKSAAEGAHESSQPEEVTLDALQHGEGEAAASIVEVYAAILLGFLVEGDKKAQEEASTVLPGNSMDCVISAVQKCLHFYVTAGALTQRTEASLRALLASLVSDNA